MTKERLKSPRARLFVALDIPDSVRSGIAGWGREALADPALRPVSAESLHITLCFLGYRPEREVERLGEILAEAEWGAPAMRLLGPMARPAGGRPRLYALEVDSPQVVSMQASLQEKLVAERLFAPEKRPFWPHITVARVRSESRGSRRPMRVAKPPGPLPGAIGRTHVRAVRASLYRSELNPQGAKYTPLVQIELPRRAAVR